MRVASNDDTEILPLEDDARGATPRINQDAGTKPHQFQTVFEPFRIKTSVEPIDSANDRDGKKRGSQDGSVQPFSYQGG
jgi:hypothetical protein